MRHGPPLWARLASRVVSYWYHHTPTMTGRGRIGRWAARWFLVARIEGDLWIRIRDFSHLPEHLLFEGHKFEPVTTESFCRLLQPGQVILDVGASLGRYALMAARGAGPTGVIHAFEPTAAIADRLCVNARLNGFRNITVHTVAVNDTGQAVTLHQYDRITELNSIVGAQTDVYDDTPWSTVTVPGITLDGFCAAEGLSRVDLVKIDVEGAELMVLQGATQLLSEETAPLLIIEFFPTAMQRAGYDTATLRGALEAYGYDCRVLEQLQWGTRNILALKPAHREWLASAGLADLPPLTDEPPPTL